MRRNLSFEEQIYLLRVSRYSCVIYTKDIPFIHISLRPTKISVVVIATHNRNIRKMSNHLFLIPKTKADTEEEFSLNLVVGKAAHPPRY